MCTTWYISLTWYYYCLFGVGGKLPNFLKRHTLATCEKYHISYFFSFLGVRWHSFHTSFCPASKCAFHVFVHCFHVYKYYTKLMWLYFRFSSDRVKLNCVTHSVKFEFLYLKPQSDIRCNRFATSPRLTISTNRRGRNKVPDRSRRGCREVGDWSGTSLRPNQSQPGFCACTKTWLRLIWSQTGPGKVADQSPISRRPIAD